MNLKSLKMPKSLIKCLLCALIITCAIPGFSSQGDVERDRHLLSARVAASHNQENDLRGVSFMQSGGEGSLRRYNPVALTLGGMMYVYQRFISPQLPSECLYHTSCSSFSISLISEYGLVRGVVATADRLMRCNRVAALDIHPLNLHPQSGKVNEGVELYSREPSRAPITDH